MAASTHRTMIRPAPNLSISAPEKGAPMPIVSCASAIARPKGSRPTLKRLGDGRQVEAHGLGAAHRQADDGADDQDQQPERQGAGSGLGRCIGYSLPVLTS